MGKKEYVEKIQKVKKEMNYRKNIYKILKKNMEHISLKSSLGIKINNIWSGVENDRIIKWIIRIKTSFINYYNYHIMCVKNVKGTIYYNKWCCLSDKDFNLDISINELVDNYQGYFDCITIKEEDTSLCFSKSETDIITLPNLK